MDIYEDIGKDPSLDSFIRKTLDPTNIAVPIQTQKRWLRSLHKEFMQVLTRLEANLINLESQPVRKQFLPIAGIKVAAKTFPFLHIPRMAIKYLLLPTHADPVRHPICQDLQTTTPADVSAFMRSRRQLRPQLLPIYDDLQLRLALRILPVRSRFWFLTQQIPNAQQCPYSTCEAIETAQHLFMKCRKSATLWSELWEGWSRFFVGPLTWTCLALPHKLKVAAIWRNQHEEIILLWNITRCIALHHRWTEGNRYCFEDTEPKSLSTTISAIYSTFGTHYRRILRFTDTHGDGASLRFSTRLLRQGTSVIFGRGTPMISEYDTSNYTSQTDQVLSSRH